MNRLINLRSTNFISKAVILLGVSVYVVAGITKLINPGHTFEALDQLTINLFNSKLIYSQQVLLIMGLAVWEIIIGLWCYTRFKTSTVLWALLGTNVFLTGISHYLSYLNKLETCGCLGEITGSFNEVHMPFLYTFSTFIIYELVKRHYQRFSAVLRNA